jgi:actin-related protein 5
MLLILLLTNLSQWMLHNFCSFTSDYPALLRKLKDPQNLLSASAIIQWPFSVPVVEEKTEEELDRLKERRKEQGRKLQEMAAAKREEKVRPSRFQLNSFQRGIDGIT